MYLLNRTIETTGEMDVIVPLLHELKEAVKQDAGLDATAWLGGNGYKPGTVVFTVAYPTLVARAEANAKFTKRWWDANRKMLPHVRAVEPDLILQYIKGGTVGGTLPAGSVASVIQMQVAQAADWLKTVEWAVGMAELMEKLSGTSTSVINVAYGTLGTIALLTPSPSAAAAEAARDALLGSTEFMPQFLKGAQFAAAGTLMSRQMTKIA